MYQCLSVEQAKLLVTDTVQSINDLTQVYLSTIRDEVLSVYAKYNLARETVGRIQHMTVEAISGAHDTIIAKATGEQSADRSGIASIFFSAGFTDYLK